MTPCEEHDRSGIMQHLLSPEYGLYLVNLFTTVHMPPSSPRLKYEGFKGNAMKICQTILVGLTTLVCVCGSASAQQSYRQLNVDGQSRRYLIYLPEKFNASEQLPVMMWFHGGGGNAAGAIFEADFRSLADDRRFILVYPEAEPDVLEGCRCWGYDSGAGEANGSYESDLAYSSAMIDDLVATYNADRDRVYAGGYSMGGSFVWDLAVAKSDEFAAIAPVAASMYMWTYESAGPALPTAVCHILGTSDFYAPYNGSSWAPSVAQQNAFWVEKNGSVTPPETTSLGGGVTRYTWQAGELCHAYQHFRRQGGGHDVPGFATTAIWDFVSQHALDGVIGCGESAIIGDLNNDGMVDGGDIGIFLTYWNTNDPIGDLDGSGFVEGADLGILLLNWTP